MELIRVIILTIVCHSCHLFDIYWVFIVITKDATLTDEQTGQVEIAYIIHIVSRLEINPRNRAMIIKLI